MSQRHRGGARVARGTASRKSGCEFRPRLEMLEDRTLMSIALNPTRWTAIGPAPIANGAPGGGPVSGRVAAIAADPTNANVLYVAPAGGGVWKSTNAGASWTPMTDNQAVLFMGALTVSRSNPNILYAGTGESNNSFDSFYGRGVLRSTNGGTSWNLLGNSVFNYQAISKIVVDPTNSNVVYVADTGDAENGFDNGNIGVWKSTNGGFSWVNTTLGIPNYDHNEGAFSDLVMDPTNPQTLYTAIGTYAGEPANGIYKTTNGGATWTPAGNAPSGLALGRIALAIAPSSPQTLYAAIAGSGNGNSFGSLLEMLKSVDGGNTWVQLTNTPNYLWAQGWYNNSLAVDPSNANIVYAGGSYNGGGPGFIQSTDGGTTWNDVGTGANGNGIHTDDHAIAFDASGRLLDGNDGGIWRLDSPNLGSILWTDLNTNLQTTQFIGVALDPTNLNVAYAGSQDNGTEKFTGTLGWNEVIGGDGGYVRVDFSNPQTVYHEFTGASVQRSDDGGNTWVDKVTGIDQGDPTNFYTPYVMDPGNSSHLLLGTDHLYQTTNRGDSWTAISAPGVNGWNSASTIDAIAVAKSDPNTIYASTGGLAGAPGADHHIFVTHNDGATWQQTDVPGFNDRFSDIKVDPSNPMVAYTVRDLFTGHAGGHVFQTTNGGAAWADISGNLPDVPTNAIVLDPRSHSIYVGTDTGVYASDNGGVTWVKFAKGLPNATVFDMDLSANLNALAVGTHGRGVWEIATTHFQMVASTTTPTAGVPFTITVTALDGFNNVMTGYVGSVHFTSTDRMAVLPADYTFTTADNGVHTFTVTLRTLGSDTVRVRDKINAGVNGMVSVTVSGGWAVAGALAAATTARSATPAPTPPPAAAAPAMAAPARPIVGRAISPATPAGLRAGWLEHSDLGVDPFGLSAIWS